MREKRFQEFLEREIFEESFVMHARYSENFIAEVSEQGIYFVGCLGFPRIQLTALKTLLIRPELSQL